MSFISFPKFVNMTKNALFSDFARFCTPKWYMCIHCLVLKNNPNYMNFFSRMISNFKYNPPPPPGVFAFIVGALGRKDHVDMSGLVNISQRLFVAGYWYGSDGISLPVMPGTYEYHNAWQDYTILSIFWVRVCARCVLVILT